MIFMLLFILCSWLCVRQQSLGQAGKNDIFSETSQTSVNISSSNCWGEDADNWGADDSEDEDSVPLVDLENGNVIMRKPGKLI